MTIQRNDAVSILTTIPQKMAVLNSKFCQCHNAIVKLKSETSKMAEACQIARKQDLPPPGGYKPIPFKRLPAKQYFSGYAMFAGYAGITLASIYLYNLTNKKIAKNEIEMRSAKMAIYPMLLAERDREYLKQLRRNRDAEAELMRDVPGWEVGTYYGERVYKMLPPDSLVEPIFHEYYAHSSPQEWYKRAYVKLMS